MKAAVIYEHGGPGSIQYKTDYPDPAPAAGEALVRVRACTLNYHDIFTRRGMPGIKVPMPAIMGLDFAGEIAAVGAGVTDWKVGERVMIDPVDRVGPGGLVGEVRPGGLAELCAVPTHHLVRLPAEVSFEDAACLPVAYGTAIRMMYTIGQIQPKDRILVLGASGGVGTAAVLLSKLAGAEVIACASSPAKLERLSEIGADHVIDYTKDDFVKWVYAKYGKPHRRRFEGGVDVVVNFTGGDTWVSSLRAVHRRGKVLTCGATAGFDPKEDLRYVWSFEIQVLGSNSFMPEDLAALLDLIRQGKLKPVVDKALPLAQVNEAFRLIEEREVFGKVVFSALHFRSVIAALLLAFVASCAQFRGQGTGSRFVVAAAHPLAVDAGYAVLERGGSALDAAIAVQMVLGLVEPESSGIGGGAFLLYWSEKDKTLRSYDGRETAPAAAHANRFLREDNTPMGFVDAVVGGRSVGVPGVLRMLELAHARHGRLPWRELFQPAIAAAEAGFPLSPRLHAQLEREPFLPKDAAARSIFYEDGKVKPSGARIVNAQYAATLHTIAKHGADAFYRGEIARDIVRAVRSNAKPGDLTEQDLAGYRALEREPLCGPYRQWRVCSMAPPSAGGVAVLQILGILERTAFARAPPLSADAVHLFSEAGRLAYADRAKYLGDPAFQNIPVGRLLGTKYLDARARLIGERSMRMAIPGDTEAVGTSHISIVDAQGNIASMTTTIEATFGSRIMVRGFLLNNELTDFDFVPGGANEIAPGKRPRSSMAPTIVFATDGEMRGTVRLALGSPGGPNIINYVAKSLVAMLDWGFDAQAAAAAPNFGSRNGPTLLEAGSFYEAMKGPLEARGHVVEANRLTSGVHAVERIPGGGWRGGADPRREGRARGQ